MNKHDRLAKNVSNRPRCETGPHKTVVDGKVVKRSERVNVFGIYRGPVSGGGK